MLFLPEPILTKVTNKHFNYLKTSNPICKILNNEQTFYTFNPAQSTPYEQHTSSFFAPINNGVLEDNICNGFNAVFTIFL
jgi:hypothetical protein